MFCREMSKDSEALHEIYLAYISLFTSVSKKYADEDPKCFYFSKIK